MTVLEVAEFYINDGQQAEFLAAYETAKTNISVSAGCRSVVMHQGVESPTRFVLLVTWDSLAAHQAFRDSERLAAWRGAITPFFAKPPFVEHVVACG